MEQIINKYNSELLEFIRENVEKGYNIYSNIDNINELIDIIVKWYEFKYTENKIKMSEERYENKNRLIMTLQEYRLRKAENLSFNMGYTELMFRIPSYLYPIIECWYKGNKDVLEDSDYIKINIYQKEGVNPVPIELSFNKYDGFDGVSSDNSTFIDNIVKDRANKLFYYITNKWDGNFDCIDFNELEKAVVTHNLDLELRNKIFTLIAIKLLNSSEDINVGYIRSKKFIEEFSMYIYNINLKVSDIEDVESMIDSDKITYIINDISNEKTVHNSIETYGLSIKTLRILKIDGIENIFDLYKQRAHYFNGSYNDGIYNEKFPLRDELLIKEMLRVAGEKLDVLATKAKEERNQKEDLGTIEEIDNTKSVKKIKIFKKFTKNK